MNLEVVNRIIKSDGCSFNEETKTKINRILNLITLCNIDIKLDITNNTFIITLIKCNDNIYINNDCITIRNFKYWLLKNYVKKTFKIIFKEIKILLKNIMVVLLN